MNWQEFLDVVAPMGVLWIIVGGGSLTYAGLADPDARPYPEVSRKTRNEAFAIGMMTTALYVALILAMLVKAGA